MKTSEKFGLFLTIVGSTMVLASCMFKTGLTTLSESPFITVTLIAGVIFCAMGGLVLLKD